MPVDIQNLPSQISGGAFQGYVEGWSWSTRFNELFLTINVSVNVSSSLHCSSQSYKSWRSLFSFLRARSNAFSSVIN